MKDFAGKCGVITGAASGLGRGLALALAERGMHIVVADWDIAGAEQTVNDVRALGVESIAVRTDVSDAESVRVLADETYERFGSMQLLVNNAAVYQHRPIWQMSAEDWRWLISINLEGPINGLLAFLPRMMVQSGERHIVITSSTNGFWVPPGQAAYNTSKFALVGLAESLATEVKDHGVQVSVACPGPMVTGLGQRFHPPSVTPEAATAMREMPESLRSMFDAWSIMDPKVAGQIVLKGIERNEFYILTHQEGWSEISKRHDRLAAAFATRAADTDLPIP